MFLCLKIAVKSSAPCRADRLKIYIKNTWVAPKVDAVIVLHGSIISSVILAQIQKYTNTQIQIQIQIQSKNCKKNWSTIVLQCNGIIIIITIIITIITIIFRELQCNWQFPLCIFSAMQRYGSSSSSSSSSSPSSSSSSQSSPTSSSTSSSPSSSPSSSSLSSPS